MEKTKEIIDYLKFSTKLRVFRYAKDCGKNKDACEVLGLKRVHSTNGKRSLNPAFIAF